MFKIVQDKSSLSVTDRIQFQQSDNELDDLEEKVAAIDASKPQLPRNVQSPVLHPKLQLKRKLEDRIKKEHKEVQIQIVNPEVINISDSENEVPSNQQDCVKKRRLEQEQEKQIISYEPLKTEKDDLEFEAFNVKQEYMGYDEAIQCDSDSDSESEQWLLRLSQSSPGKPFIKVPRENKVSIKEESSYSQLEDYVDDDDNNEEYEDDLISIPHQPPEDKNEVPEEMAADEIRSKEQEVDNQKDDDEEEEFLDDLISLQKVDENTNEQPSKTMAENTRDEIDGSSTVHISKDVAASSVIVNNHQNEKVKKTQFIEPLVLQPRKKIIAAESKFNSLIKITLLYVNCSYLYMRVMDINHYRFANFCCNLIIFQVKKEAKHTHLQKNTI